MSICLVSICHGIHDFMHFTMRDVPSKDQEACSVLKQNSSTCTGATIREEYKDGGVQMVTSCAHQEGRESRMAGNVLHATTDNASPSIALHTSGTRTQGLSLLSAKLPGQIRVSLFPQVSQGLTCG